MKKDEERTPLTLEDLQDFLAESGVLVRYNVISKELQVMGMPGAYNPETLVADLHVILHDYLKRVFRCSKDQVADLLGVIAGMERVNPVTNMLAMTSWDGKDRLEELYRVLDLPEDDALSRTLLRKWLMQSVAMARNELKGAYGADGMLVLCGPQGAGKTSLVRALGVDPGLYKLGQWLDARDKDTFRRCTSAWIVELGELETTLRSDLERLKAFVTAERDEYRLPYGRADQVLARRTSLVATCNSDQFLIDPTGSRRFWTVPVRKIDLEALREMDMLQLWKQAETELDREGGQSFRLTADERHELSRRNTRHEKPLKSQPEIEDILGEAICEYDAYTWEEMTVSDFKAEYSSLQRYTVQQIAIALDRIGITVRRSNDGPSQRKLRRLPRRK